MDRKTTGILGFIAVVLALVIGMLAPQPVEAQNAFRGISKTFTTQTTTGATTGFAVSSAGQQAGIPVNHTIELITTGGPSGCTYSLQGSSDNSTWFTISASSITCTTTTVAFEANKPTKYVRGNLLTLTGGTAPTVTLKYVGK